MIAILVLTAMKVYIYNFRTIGHLIQDLVTSILLKKQRLHLHIFTGKFGRGETGYRHHPFFLGMGVIPMIEPSDGSDEL